MNKVRRKRIAELVKKIAAEKDILEGILFEETDYHDNIPDNLQGSERAEESEDCIDLLENALEQLNEVIDGLEEI